MLMQDADDYTGKTTDELIEDWKEFKTKMDKDFEDLEQEARLKFLMEGQDDKLRTTHKGLKKPGNRTSTTARVVKSERRE